MQPLADAIKQHAKQWVSCYGNVLQESAKTGLFNLQQELQVSYLIQGQNLQNLKYQFYVTENLYCLFVQKKYFLMQKNKNCNFFNSNIH